MELYAGLDLHSRNTYIGIMDVTFNRVFKKRVSNDLDQILRVLNPFQDRIKGFVVESTYNWYWLVDGLMDAGYGSAHLAKTEILSLRANYHYMVWLGQANRQDDSSKTMAANLIQRALMLCLLYVEFS